MIVFEFCAHGNLRDHLRRLRPADTQPAGISMETMLTFMHQISSGMAYLECKGVVHGDLAASVVLLDASLFSRQPRRTVLLSSENICKVSDFGINRAVYATRLLQRHPEPQT